MALRKAEIQYIKMMNIKTKPNYKRIYKDILDIKHLEKKEECKWILRKKELSTMDILELNKRIFGETENQKYRSYSKADILKILDYQQQNQLSNTQLANHFRLSRNTVAKWKKHFLMIGISK